MFRDDIDGIVAEPVGTAVRDIGGIVRSHPAGRFRMKRHVNKNKK